MLSFGWLHEKCVVANLTWGWRQIARQCRCIFKHIKKLLEVVGLSDVLNFNNKLASRSLFIICALSNFICQQTIPMGTAARILNIVVFHSLLCALTMERSHDKWYSLFGMKLCNMIGEIQNVQLP
jgi:hypothetical protein